MFQKIFSYLWLPTLVFFLYFTCQWVISLFGLVAVTKVAVLVGAFALLSSLGEVIYKSHHKL
jgi:lipopolysaccharide/colanic/teichoic acid biosynthesis glycosyltransferase